ncbi:MAG TPA: DUF58 domain-containing protein [Urbifossiella sp.]|nr:DUF58 domain-containing protein [Urbifossiella sp.]
MLTSRGWWFLALNAVILLLGVTALPDYTVVPAIVALTLVAWFLYEWVAFHIQVNAAASRLKFTRRIIQGDREVPMVWAGLQFDVRLRIEHDSRIGLAFVAFEDRLPQVAQLLDGDNEKISAVPPNEPVRMVYGLKAPSPGILRFEGVKVLVADLHGFFHHRAFLHDETEYLILPPLTDDEGKQRADKRFNTLPPPGIHRLRRPGSGGELLDLRDYRPGDPPKMIAWKASARRDRLITKEYESDVPVRCVLFLDTSDGVRLGPPAHTPLAKMAGLASGVAQAAAGNRDLVGLATFDEHEQQGVKPARTKIHMIGMLRRLAEAAALQPSTKGVPAVQLTARAYPLAREIYPELMDKKINGMPLGRMWLPLLDRRWGWIVLVWCILPVLFPMTLYFLGLIWPVRLWMEGIAYLAVELAKARGGKPILGILPPKLFFAMFLWWLPTMTGLIFWFFHGMRGWFGERKRQLTRRKGLAALLALQDGTGPTGIERLIHDDALYAERVGRFMQERQVRMPVPLYDELGRYRFHCGGKCRMLARAVMQAVSRARDNELYVIMADLAELGADLAPALRAAKLARARRHQVMVIVPWPADLPSPDDKPPLEPVAPKPPPKGKKKKKKKPAAFQMNHPKNLMPIVRDALTRQYHEAFRQFRRRFGQVGATVVRVDEGDPVQVVLDRLDRLRGVRTRR